MKHAILVLTTVESLVVVDTDENVPDVCRDGRELEATRNLVGRMRDAAENYVERNGLVVKNLGEGNWSQRTEYLGEAKPETTKKVESIKLEEWE